MKRQIRASSAEQILRRIDRAMKLLGQHRVTEAKFNGVADAMFQNCDNIKDAGERRRMGELARDQRGHATGAARKAAGAEKRLRALGRKLAEFQTEPLPGIVPDRTVSL